MHMPSTRISIKNLTTETLNKAALLRAEIDRLEKELINLLTGRSISDLRIGKKNNKPNTTKFSLVESDSNKNGKRKKRNLSPEARARIVAAVKARWAREKAKAKTYS